MPDTPIKSTLRTLPVLTGPFPNTSSNPDEFPPTPQETFQTWLSHAISSQIPEPHTMTASTTDEHNYPDARVLILKNLDERGWHFAAKGGSPKARQPHGNRNMALTFYWPGVGRQVRVRGRVVVLGEEECGEDFGERSLGSRVSAMASVQSRVLEDREVLVRRAAEVEEAMASGKEDEVSMPEWKVYAVDPVAVEFWQGSSDRLHQRLQYVRKADCAGWVKELLWP
ncbi:pyridoxine/pyridoxamine 5'-phosphate oxidase [Aspergillus glaucus CBS 516.65]|uniref:pyridoxal 5'-phosphate synthase n=1 Tax=Aspergillus glaucus CBS 516.65 TaxID=1160497 RepID=A0A1L9VUN0_ASPGL|nr:hypothetical protein ASPGLDRAFT_63766 [Aspergillus glaucus CBS 516.65]OJJ87615.1 hypothetical protein ASPGLDRAFT_63766 [Aspergillus glaucus CBS 516.65]